MSNYRADCRFAPSQWETVLFCNDVSHWLGANLDSVLYYFVAAISRHDDVTKWKHFPRYWPFVRGIHRWIPRTKASDTELCCFFDLRLNKRLSKHSSGWWFVTLSRPLWRHYNGLFRHKCMNLSWQDNIFLSVKRFRFCRTESMNLISCAIFKI